MDFDIKQILPMLHSLGINPKQLGPEKLALLQKLLDPSKIGTDETNNLLKTLGIGRKNTQPKKHKYKKISRNEPCLCGSGSKYKKCCGTL